jgi:hypothetical protein
MKLQSITITFEKHPKSILRDLDGNETVKDWKHFTLLDETAAESKKGVNKSSLKKRVDDEIKAAKKSVEKSFVSQEEKEKSLEAINSAIYKKKLTEKLLASFEAKAQRDLGEKKLEIYINKIRKFIEENA